MATRKKAEAKPTLPEDEQARADDEKARADQAAKEDGAYEGDTENTAPYMNAYE